MNQRELQTLYESYHADMVRLAKIMLYDETESQDVVSDVFAWLAYTPLSLQGDSVRPYLMTCVRNKCINIINKKKLRQRVAGLYTLETLNEGMGNEDERVECLQQFIQRRLDKKDQQILAMRFAQGMKSQEIATVLHISEVAVYKHLSQSIKTIRNYFTKNKKP